jgi:hypothetical protein
MKKQNYSQQLNSNRMKLESKSQRVPVLSEHCSPADTWNLSDKITSAENIVPKLPVIKKVDVKEAIKELNDWLITHKGTLLQGYVVTERIKEIFGKELVEEKEE